MVILIQEMKFTTYNSQLNLKRVKSNYRKSTLKYKGAKNV